MGFIIFGCFLLGTGSLYLFNKQAELLEALPLSALFIFLGLGFALVVDGVEIDVNNKKYRQYLRVYFLKVGQWHSFSSNNDILCLRSKEKHVGFNEITNRDTEFSGPLKYEIYIADSNHFKLTLLKTSTSNLDAEHDADELAERLGLQWVQYNPGRQRPRRVLGGVSVI